MPQITPPAISSPGSGRGARVRHRMRRAVLPAAGAALLFGTVLPGSAAALAAELPADGATEAATGSPSVGGGGGGGGLREVTQLAGGGAANEPRDLTAVGNALYFTAGDRAHGRELWRVGPGAAGATMVADLAPGSASSDPAELTAVGDALMFTAVTPGHGRELWRSNGTAAGTTLVAHTQPGSASGEPSGLRAAGGALYFDATVPGSGRELWRSDGTPAGTAMVTDLRAGAEGSDPGEITPLSTGSVVFAATDAAHGRELWRSDGTAAGTTLARDVRPGPAGSDPAEISITPISRIGTDLVHFVADDGAVGREPWSISLPTVPLLPGGPTDVRQGPSGSNPAELIADAGTGALVSADNGTNGRELVDTSAGLIADVRPGAAGSDPTQLTRLGYIGLAPGVTFRNQMWFERVAFSAEDGQHGREVWLAEIGYYSLGSQGFPSIVQKNARLLLDLAAGSAGSTPEQLTPVSGTLLFSADDGRTGRELWRSNGSAATTSQVADLAPGRRGSNPAEITPVGQTVYLTADNGHGRGRQIYSTTVRPSPWLSASVQYAEPEEPVTISVSVDGSAAQARPTGTLTFSEGSTTLGRATLRAVEGSPTTAVATWSGVLAPGGHDVIVTYGGNARLAPAVAPPVGVSVINSTISMTVDPDPIVSGQPFTATVTVGAAPGGVPGTPSGTVTVPANGGGTPVALDTTGTARVALTAPVVTEPTQVSYIVSYSGDGTFDQRYAQIMVNAVPG